MHSSTVFDNQKKIILLSRDKVGKKPLYYTLQNGEFAYSSSLKELDEKFKKKPSDRVLIEFMTLGYIPKSSSYYENIHKLEAGHHLEFRSDTKELKVEKHWDLPTKKIDIDYKSATYQSEKLLINSIEKLADQSKNIGSFLSGGVDSSLVASLLQERSKNSIKTFALGFENSDYDESIYARDVADQIGSDHYEFIFSSKDLLSLIEEIDQVYDEPFGNSSALAMMLLCKKTREYTDSVLSGDGGDELFLGYDRYFLTQKYLNIFAKSPQIFRNISAYFLERSGVDRLQKLSYPLKNLTLENLYSLLYTATKPWELTSLFDKDFIYSIYGKYELTLLDILDYEFDGDDTIDSLSRLDFKRYLPDDSCTKVHFAASAYGLNVMLPLLDEELVEFVYSLPTSIKLQNGTKSILRDILHKRVSKNLIDRPKKGFGVPLKHWFRNELKEITYAKILSLDNRFNKKYLLSIFDQHQKGRNFEYLLWNILRVR